MSLPAPGTMSETVLNHFFQNRDPVTHVFDASLFYRWEMSSAKVHRVVEMLNKHHKFRIRKLNPKVKDCLWVVE